MKPYKYAFKYPHTLFPYLITGEAYPEDDNMIGTIIRSRYFNLLTIDPDVYPQTLIEFWKTLQFNMARKKGHMYSSCQR